MTKVERVCLPPLDSEWKLMKDVPMSADFFAYKNSYLSNIFRTELTDWPGYATAKTGPGFDWAPYHEWRKKQIESHVLPAGTLIVFDRYHISHSGEDEITIRILSCPDARISPKKAGGLGKGPSRVYIGLATLNTFGDMERTK